MSTSNEIFLYYGSGSTPCWRVQIVLEEKNIKYGQKLLSFDKKEHKNPEILELNPRGQFPTLKIGSTTLNESLGACFYLEDVYKQQGTQLIPDDHLIKARVLQRGFEALNLQKYVNENIVYYIWMTPKDKIDDNLLAERKKELNIEMNRWESYLIQQNTRFIASDNFSFGDVIFFPQLAFAVRSGYPIEKHPKLNEYYESVKNRPSVQATWPPHWKETPNAKILEDC